MNAGKEYARIISHHPTPKSFSEFCELSWAAFLEFLDPLSEEDCDFLLAIRRSIRGKSTAPSPPNPELTTWVQNVDLALPRAHTKELHQHSSGEIPPAYRHYPKAFAPWTDFVTSALNFDVGVHHQSPHWRETMVLVLPDPHTLESHVEESFLLNVRGFFAGSTLPAMRKPESKLSPLDSSTPPRKKARTDIPDPAPPSPRSKPAHREFLVGEPDLVATIPGSKCVVGIVEVETFWNVDLDDNKTKSLVEKLNERVFDASTQAAAQTVGYMLDNHCKYGALTTYQSTRFFSAENEDLILVSDVIKADDETSSGVGPPSVTLRRAFAYWLSLCAASTPKDYGTVDHSSNDWKPTPKDLPPSTTSLADRAAEHDSTDPHLSGALTLEPEVPLWKHPLFVRWDDLDLLSVIGSGRSGNVALAKWKDRRIALKLFDVAKRDPDFFADEFQAYLKLKQMGNSRTAELLLVTIAPSGQVLGLGLQLGRPMPRLSLWSQEQREGALEALRSLLGAGLVQQDVRDVNFVQDDTGKVLAIDLEDAEPSWNLTGDCREQERYLESARRLLFETN